MQPLFPSLAKLRSIQSQILRVDPTREVGLVPNPAATPTAIAAVETRLGLPLPPSYRRFLLRHDGWPRCFEGASLLGTAELGRRDYDAFARAAFQAAETPIPELGPPKTLSYPRVIPFGIDAAATVVFAFNPGSVSAKGEYEVVGWVNELGTRSDDFESFLEDLVELSRADLEAVRAVAAGRILGLTA